MGDFKINEDRICDHVKHLCYSGHCYGDDRWFRIPLDIISAPACNIALGLGIDSMIHMVRAYRRQKHQNKKDAEAWADVRHRFWQPVLTFTLVMVLGFGIFSFSEFPSTQRFGVAVVFGALIASMTALFVMPTTAQIELKLKNNIDYAFDRDQAFDHTLN